VARQTSIVAYREIEKNGLLSQRRAEVYRWVFHNGPTTARRAYKSLTKGKAINPSSYLSRFSELRDVGVFEEIGHEIDAETNQTVIVWDVTKNLPKKITKTKLQMLRAKICVLEIKLAKERRILKTFENAKQTQLSMGGL